MIINGIEIHELRSNVVDGYSPSGATIIDAIDNLLRFKAENEQLRTQRWSYKEANGILNQQVEELRQQLAKAQKNTERYQWLRSFKTTPQDLLCVFNDERNPPSFTLKASGELDAAIDAAIAQQKEQSPSSDECGNCDNQEHCKREYGICVRAPSSAPAEPFKMVINPTTAKILAERGYDLSNFEINETLPVSAAAKQPTSIDQLAQQQGLSPKLTAAFLRLSHAIGNPAFCLTDKDTIEEALIDEAVKRLTGYRMEQVKESDLPPPDPLF